MRSHSSYRSPALALAALLLFGCGAALAQQPAAETQAAVTADQPAAAEPAAEAATKKEPAADAQPLTLASNRANAGAFGRPATLGGFADGEAAAARADRDPAAHLLKPSRTLAPQAGGSPQQTGGTNQANPLPPPLTAGQKVRRAFRRAFLSPAPYAITAFNAALTQAGEDELPNKDFEDEFGDWASRFARSFATRTTRTLFGSGFYPAIFKQDPRYDRAQKKGFLPRTGHAVSRVFVTRDDDGNVEPNYSRIAGSFTAAAMANIWERSTPGHDRIGTDATFRRFGRSFINDALTNVIFREFWPDIMKIFGR
jgi:hypothetical protein